MNKRFGLLSYNLSKYSQPWLQFMLRHSYQPPFVETNCSGSEMHCSSRCNIRKKPFPILLLIICHTETKVLKLAFSICEGKLCS